MHVMLLEIAVRIEYDRAHSSHGPTMIPALDRTEGPMRLVSVYALGMAICACPRVDLGTGRR